MRPTLVVNPVTDRDFGAFAELQLDDGATTIGELQDRLRVRYPRAAVHARDLASERVTVWYVYRDGHWTDPGSTVADRRRGEGMPDAREDLRATSEAIQDDAERLAALEARKRSLDAADPEVAELSREIETLTRQMADKATAERELSEEIESA